MTLLDILPSLRHATKPRLDPAVWPHTTHVDEGGAISVGGVALTDIADHYGTPCYVLDEEDFHHRIRSVRRALGRTEMIYAGKALLTAGIARRLAADGVGVDVCSPGELAAALAGGVDPARIVLHGNAKSHEDLQGAVNAGVGRIVLDSPLEITYLAGLAQRPQQVLIRVTPEIDIDGHPALTTGIADAEFGLTADDGQLAEAVERVLAEPRLNLVGLHCHLGSQITDAAVYGEAVHRMVEAMADIRRHHGVILPELNWPDPDWLSHGL
jgi:diaminopimelate decarboxylase